MSARDALLAVQDIQAALGPRIRLLPAAGSVAPTTLGNILRQAARDSAFHSFSGFVNLDGKDRPVGVSEMILEFDMEVKAMQTFDRVAAAAHLRTTVNRSEVAVETAAGEAGLVSYWGFIYRSNTIVVLTLDTFDPQHLSMADFRALVVLGAERLASATA